MLSGKEESESSDFKLLYKSPGGGDAEYVSPRDFLRKVSTDAIPETDPDDIIDQLLSQLVSEDKLSDKKSKKKKKRKSTGQ